MAISKVVYGGDTLIDLTGDTVTPLTLANGATAHNKAGEKIVGTMTSGGGSTYVLDLQVELTDGEEAIVGELTADQCTAIVANAPNVVVKLTGLEDGLNMYIPLAMAADGQYVFVMQIDTLIVAVLADCTSSIYNVMISEVSQGENVDTESILNSAKSYADTAVQTAKTEAKSYTDTSVQTAKNEAKTYTDNAKAEAKRYTDSAVSTIQSALASYIDDIDTLIGGDL